MTKSHVGSKRVSLFSFSSLPVSYDLLSPKVAQVDDAIEKKPLEGINAWKDSRLDVSVPGLLDSCC